jgi:plastocyanin
MLVNFSRAYIMIHLFAVLALGIAPFVFFSVYADESQNGWTVTIPNGASNQDLQREMYPKDLPVSVGDVIIWKNEDNVPHSITSGLPKHPEFAGQFFKPGKVNPGKSISQELFDSDFNSFYYFCEIHPWLTGNIFLSNIPIAQPETSDPIFTEKLSYNYGDIISFSGKVHIDFAKTDYTYLIYNQNNDLVHFSEGTFDEESAYTETIISQGKKWNKNGNYKISLVYAVPTKIAQTNFIFSNEPLSFDSNKTIPIWIKNVGGFWCNGQITDIEFLDAIQFLISKNIIHVEKTDYENLESHLVPGWVKNNACWWADNKIPDLDFMSGIEYLVNIGSINV